MEALKVESSTTVQGGASIGASASAVAGKSQGSDTMMGLGKSDFFKLLVAQLRNQDPLKPMEDREFIAQMAQLNTVEQLHTMNARLSELLDLEMMAQASGLVGRTVEAERSEGSVISGVVQEVIVGQGIPILIVNGHAVQVSDVFRIR